MVSSITITAHNSLCSTHAYHLRIDLAQMPLLGNVACNFKKNPRITQDLSRRLIRPFCIMFSYCYLYFFIHNNAFWSNSNAFSIIICKVHTKREISDSWKSGPGKATSGHLLYTTPNKLKLYGDFYGIYEEY